MLNAFPLGLLPAEHPRIRLDEGLVASKRQRWWTPLAKKAALTLALLVPCGHLAWGQTYTWTGASSSAFSDGGNWSGGVAPSSSDNDINLVFPNRNNTVSGIGTLTVKNIVLNGGTTELQFGASGGTFTVNGVISGAGALTSTGHASANSVVNLNGANTFSGGYYQNGGQVVASNNKSFGTGPVKARCNGKPAYSINFNGATEIANDISVGNEATSSIGTVNVAKAVRLTGKFTYAGGDCAPTVTANANCRFGGSAQLTLAGPVVTEVSGYWIHYGGAIIVEQPIKGNLSPFSFNNGTLLELKASGNELKGSVNWNNWSAGASTLRISADDVFANPTVVSSGTAAGVKTLDLNGHDLTLQGYYSGGRVDPVATSATLATLTITGDNANRVYGGAFTGALSLVYDCAGRTYTLTNTTSTMTGRLEVRAGKVVVTEGAAFTKLSAISVADEATLQVTATAGDVAAKRLAVGAISTLDLGGKSLTVKMLTVDGEPKPAGVYKAADCSWLAGDGSTVTVEEGGYDPAWWVWTGDAGGEWNAPGNWMRDGKVCTTAPGAGDTLCLDGASAGNPFLVSTSVTLANPIVLGAGQQVISCGASGSTVTLTGVISGVGGIAFQGTSNKAVLRLNAENTFEGGVCRAGAGQVQLGNAKGLGTGAFTVVNPAGLAVAAPMSFRVDGTVKNDMTFLAENATAGWNGAIAVSTKEVHLTGAITFTGDTRIGMNSASKLYFEGPTTVSGRLTHNNSNADIYFTTVVKGNGYLHTDQGHGRWHLMQGGNALKHVYLNGNGTDAKVLCEAEQAFPESAYVQFNATGAHKYVFDLGGYDQTLAYLYDSTATCPATHYVNSDKPATLTIQPTADYLCRAGFTGAASLNLKAAAGKTYTLAGAIHTTRGAFTVTSGALKLSDGATATALSEIAVAPGAKLVIDGTAGLVSAGCLAMAQGGVVEVAEGKTLTVDYATLDGEDVPAATYASGSCDWVKGGGAVKVIVSGCDGLYVWTGKAGGEWNTPGNWDVSGEPATTAPTPDKTLYIGAATPERPFLVTQGVEIKNPVMLGVGQQYMQLGFGDGVLHLSGRVTGSGGIQFDSRNNAQYYARLSNAANDFVGGVRRSGAGQIQLFNANALGSGLVTLDDGSRMNSGIANRQPFYVAQSCTIPNDFRIGGESFASWNGWWNAASGITVRFAGKVAFYFNGDTYQTRFFSASTFHFDGPVSIGSDTVNGRLICKGGSKVYFHQPIKAEGDRRKIYADNESFTGYFCASSNQISEIAGDAIVNWKWYLQARDALAGVDVALNNEPNADGSGFLLDLGGFDQHLANLSYAKAVSDKFLVTSPAPATLTVEGTADHFFGGRFESPVALTYSPKGDFVYTLSNAVHSTTGAVTVTRGTLQLVKGASFAKTRNAEVLGGTLRLTEPGALGRRTELRLNGGTLRLDEGTTTVANLYFGTSDEKQEAGLWGAVGNPNAQHHDSRITGDGLLNVRCYCGGTLLIVK